MQSSNQLCEHCKQRPQYQGHRYCGRTCATKAGKAAQRSDEKPQPSQTDLCENCKVKPKYREPSGFTHPYCSKTCVAKSARRELDRSLCLWCRRSPAPKTHFCCKSCALAAEARGPILLEVPNGHDTFRNVEEQFNKSWRHNNKPRPTIRRLYKIILSQSSEAVYSQYRSSVEARCRFLASGMSAGNENRRWHGTRRECTVGDNGDTKLCDSSTCALCSIIRTSYDVKRCRSGTSFERFGAGIYTSSTSSKSHDYAKNGSQSSSKAILLNKVVVGHGFKLQTGNSSLRAPPPGFDSVLGETGKELNYDELVIYKNEAIRPSFLVLYDA